MFFVPPSRLYASYIDWKVLACLLCLMAVVSGLRKTGLFDIAALALTRLSGGIRSMAIILILSTFFVSMAVTNDVALITFVPFSLLLLKKVKTKRTKLTVITLQTIAANIGSSLTPIGNPQNLYLFSFYKMDAVQFFTAIAPVVAAGGFLLIAAAFTIKNEKMTFRGAASNQSPNIVHIIVYFLLFTLSVLAVFRIIDYRAALVLVILTLLLLDRGLFRLIDYTLLWTFAGFFVFIGNLQHIGAVTRALTSIVDKNALLVSTLASQVISNVPAAILLSRFTQDSTALLRGVSIGGMGTIIASLASVISYKFFVHEYPEENFAFLKVFTIWNVAFLVFLYGICLLLEWSATVKCIFC